MQRKTILYVEDRKENILSLQDEVDEWNERHIGVNREFRIVSASSHDAALRELSEVRVDCVLLDLRVPMSEGTQDNADVGNGLAVEVLKSRGMPLAVISGYIGELENDTKHGGLVGVFDKGDVTEEGGYRGAVTWLGSQWEMMQVLTLSRMQIDRSTAEIFVKRLWPQWEALLKVSGSDQERLATVVSRQFMSHAADLFGLEVSENETWHPFENYVVPPLLDSRAHTGDIFDLDGERWIVLTPQCDMATGKVQTILLAKCSVGIDGFRESVDALNASETSNKARLKAERMLRDNVNQNVSPSLHFLPPIPGEEEALMVEFGTLKVLEKVYLEANLASRVASVSTPFLSNLVQRFGASASRAGQPNIDVKNF